MAINKSIIPKPDGKQRLVKVNFDTQDIINLMLEADKLSVDYMADFISQFETSKNGLKQYHDWLCNEIQYIADSEESQEVLSANQAIYRGYADCKGFTIALLSFAKCKGLDYKIIFASYKMFDPTPTHVYPAVKIDGKYINADCVLTINPAIDSNGVAELEAQKRLVKYRNKFGQSEFTFYKIEKIFEKGGKFLRGINKSIFKTMLKGAGITAALLITYKAYKIIK